MLNYIWAGLIISSLVFALVADVTDLSQDRYRNDQAFPVELVFPDGFDPEARRQPVQVRVDPTIYREFYGTDETPDSTYSGVLIALQEGRQVRLAPDARLPEPLATIRDVTNPRDEQLQGIVVDRTVGEPAVDPGPPEFDAVQPGEEDVQPSGDTTPVPEDALPGPVQPETPLLDAQQPDAAPAGPEQADLSAAERQALAEVDPEAVDVDVFAVALRFEQVRFVNMNNIAQAALDFATTAAEIALGLIGVLALFLGLLKIGEEAGIIRAMVRFVRPVLRPLFPTIPADHPALGMIALNMTANIFGLGNAATPFGIKAMEELQTLNKSEHTATDPMVMLLAVNTASVQLVPPVLLMALMGLQINQLIFAIIITTGISLIVAISAAKVLGRLPAYRRTDPNRELPPDEDGPPPGDQPAV